MNWYPAACPVCRGDLHDDIQDKGWVRCFSCARSFRLVDACRPQALPLKAATAESSHRFLARAGSGDARGLK